MCVCVFGLGSRCPSTTAHTINIIPTLSSSSLHSLSARYLMYARCKTTDTHTHTTNETKVCVCLSGGTTSISVWCVSMHIFQKKHKCITAPKIYLSSRSPLGDDRYYIWAALLLLFTKVLMLSQLHEWSSVQHIKSLWLFHLMFLSISKTKSK